MSVEVKYGAVISERLQEGMRQAQENAAGPSTFFHLVNRSGAETMAWLSIMPTPTNG